MFLHLIECLHYRSNVNVPQQLALCEAWRGLGALAEELPWSWLLTISEESERSYCNSLVRASRFTES